MHFHILAEIFHILAEIFIYLAERFSRAPLQLFLPAAKTLSDSSLCWWWAISTSHKLQLSAGHWHKRFMKNRQATGKLGGRVTAQRSSGTACWKDWLVAKVYGHKQVLYCSVVVWWVGNLSICHASLKNHRMMLGRSRPAKMECWCGCAAVIQSNIILALSLPSHPSHVSSSLGTGCATQVPHTAAATGATPVSGSGTPEAQWAACPVSIHQPHWCE